MMEYEKRRLERQRQQIELLKEREGFRDTVYTDTTGNPTIGYGHKIQEGETFTTITEEEAEELLLKDYQKAYEGAQRIMNDYAMPIGHNITHALTGMVFQLGEQGTREFKKTLAYLTHEMWDDAILESKNSKWHNQTPTRTGDFENYITKAKDESHMFAKSRSLNPLWRESRKLIEDLQNNKRKKGGFINMQEGSLVLDQPTVTTTPTPRPIQVTTSDPNDPNIGLPTGPDPAGFVPYPTTQIPQGYVNPREQFPFSGFGSGSGKYSKTGYLTAPSTYSSDDPSNRAKDQLISNVENAFLIDRGKEIDAKQLERELNFNLSQGVQTYDPEDIS